MQSIGFSDLIQSGFCCCRLEANLGPQQFMFYILFEAGTIHLCQECLMAKSSKAEALRVHCMMGMTSQKCILNTLGPNLYSANALNKFTALSCPWVFCIVEISDSSSFL